MDDARIEALVRESVKNDPHHTFEDCMQMLRTGAAGIFQNDHGCWIFQIVETKLLTYCNVWIVAGELPGVLELEDQVTEFARSKGCTKITSVCRYGYGRSIARERDWKITGLVVEKAIPPIPSEPQIEQTND